MSFYQYLILFFVPVLGGISALVLQNRNTVINLKYLIAFSGAYLLGISILHLLPEAYHDDYMVTGKYILLGFFIQVILEQFSSGIEHGHMHSHHKTGQIISIMLGLSIHSLIEGLPLAGDFHHHDTQNPFLYGIALHKLPAAFALVVVLLNTHLSKLKIFSLLIFFAAISPSSAWLAAHLGIAEHFSDKHMGLLIGLVVGSFLHISTTILFESSSESHRFSPKKILAILVGILLALFT